MKLKTLKHDQNQTKNYDLKAKICNFKYLLIFNKIIDILNKNPKQEEASLSETKKSMSRTTAEPLKNNYY